MKRIVRAIVRFSGLVRLVRYLNRRKVTILTLHGVAGRHPKAGWQPLWPRPTPETLDRVLVQLSRHYRFISLDHAVAMVAGERPVIERALVLTFDDGYRNNIREALPVLRKHGAPATFFVATGFVGNGRSYWIDRLDYALQAAPDEARRLEAGGLDFDLRGGSRAELANGYRRLRLAVKASIESDEEMLEVMRTLAESLEEAAGASIEDVIGDDPFASVATWNELGEVAHDGVLIGSHTVDHLRLDRVDEHSMTGQLRHSKAEIEQRLGIECALFCYPNGNFDAQVVAKTREAGYRAAVTTERGLNAVGDDVYTLKRYPFPTRATAFDNLLAISGLEEAPVLRRLAGRAR